MADSCPSQTAPSFTQPEVMPKDEHKTSRRHLPVSYDLVTKTGQSQIVAQMNYMNKDIKRKEFDSVNRKRTVGGVG